METKSASLPGVPPKLISSFVVGFNTVTTHIHLVLFPIALDLFLWLGPHLSLKLLLNDTITQLSTMFSRVEITNAQDLLNSIKEFGTQFNILSLLRAFPIGIPSLMSGLSPILTPFGQASILEIDDPTTAILICIGFTFLGVVLGSFFLDFLCRATAIEETSFSIQSVLRQTGRLLLLCLLVMILLLALIIPGSMMLSVIMLISPTLGQIALLIGIFFLIWILVPMVFSPHGIFVNQFNPILSILNSIRLVRFFLPGTGVFLLIVILLNQGMNTLWAMGTPGTWMAAIGIFGHGFVSTALLTASFIYYRDGMRWMREAQQRLAHKVGNKG